MGWDGNGNFVRTNGTNTGNTVWQDDRDDGVKIRADRHDTHDEDLAGGIENTVALDGQNTTTTGNAILRYNAGQSKFAGVSIGTNEIVLRQSSDLIGLSVAASRLVGRKSTGDVGVLTPSEGRTVLALGNAAQKGVTGSDADAVTGTAGTDGNLAQWNTDGDLVDGPGKTGADANAVTGTAGTDGNFVQWNSDGDAVDSGVPISAVGALVPLAQATASDDASVEFTSNIDGTYDEYVFVITGARLASNGEKVQIRMSNDGGSTWDSGATDYSYVTDGNRSDGTVQRASSNGASVIDLMDPTPGSADSGKTANIQVRLSDPGNSAHVTSVDWVASTFDDNSRTNLLNGAGHRRTNSAINAIQFRGSGVNIAEGEFRLYGVKKS